MSPIYARITVTGFPDVELGITRQADSPASRVTCRVGEDHYEFSYNTYGHVQTHMDYVLQAGYAAMLVKNNVEKRPELPRVSDDDLELEQQDTPTQEP